jgi:hypothetical protein
MAVGVAVAAPAVADVNEITVARFDDPVGTETLVLRLECRDLCQLCSDPRLARGGRSKV